MALLSKVGLCRGKNLAILAVVYAGLAIGAVTMVVPFLMTLTTSVTTMYDLPQYNILPRFLYDDDALFIKYVFEKYGSNAASYDTIKKVYEISRADTLAELSEASQPLKRHFGPLEHGRWDPSRLAAAKKDWSDFWETIRRNPEDVLLFTACYPDQTRKAYQDFLRARYLSRWSEAHPAEAKKWRRATREKAALALMNQTYGEVAGVDFDSIPFYLGDQGRLWSPDKTPRLRDCMEFLATLPAESVYMKGLDFAYQDFLFEQYPTLDKLNAAWGSHYPHWARIRFSTHPPSHPVQMSDWSKFVTRRMPARMVRFEQRPSDAEFQRWMLRRYESLTHLNLTLRTHFKSVGDIRFSPTLPEEHGMRFPWVEFASEHIPARQWKFPHPLQKYHDFLLKRYGTLEEIGKAYGQSYAGIEEVRPPLAAIDRMDFLARRSHWRWFFTTNNYVQVFQFIALKGNALWNTLLLVAASLAGALTLNPLTAYALSRFRIKNKRMILAFLLIPMSFPADVAQIPSFLLTRNLGLLNTYWALILPGLANGFSIFMLKGFFDSLPRELYEAAELDGASELQIYWNVTFPLCKPILALTTIGVVISAYSGYMWALIVCPDEKMWTLAVWIFQYSVDATQQGHTHLQMAALVLMSIPTLLIFLFTQKIIMKGIVLPTMK